jgi:hypothetical protein
MRTAQIPLCFVQYADFARTLTWLTGPDKFSAVPVDLTGWTSELMVRDVPSGSSLILSISTTPGPQGSIALGGVLGTIALVVPNAATALLPPGSFVHGLQMISPSGLRRVLATGPVLVEPGTVRP